MAPKISSGAKPSIRPQIDAGEKPNPAPKISFSLQYWRQQVPYFAFAQTQRDWFVGLLDRLRVISEMTRSQWDGAVHGSDAWRYHRIDWNAIAIPIKKTELNWVPPYVLQNEEEFPIYQFGLGAGHGRVAGFWEAHDRFAIVLLDPKHNLQPSGAYGYRVTECGEQPNPAGLVHLAIDHARENLKCAEEVCPVHAALATITVRKRVDAAHHYNEVVCFGLDEADQKNLGDLLAEKQGLSVAKVFKKGLDVLTDELLSEMDGSD